MSSLYQHLVSQLHLGDVLWRFQKRGLYCFNFHRIGDWRGTDFDPCVFSCAPKDLRSYLRFLKENFSLIGLDEVSALVAEDRPLNERLALVTFDDGYRDNFTEALPVLQEEGVSATFFITTSLIESGSISWWDEIAWHVRKLGKQQVKLPGWKEAVVLGGSEIRQDVRKILNQVKISGVSVEEQVEAFRQLSGDAIESTDENQIFMNWQELNEMIKAGMTIGAHSHSHEIFANLSEESLKYELLTSKRILEEKLGIEVRTLSYPVGHTSSFRVGMFDMIRNCGYDLAFSFDPVVNVHPSAHRYQLGRISIDASFNRSRMIERCVSLRRV